jgi:hypothetical protein
MFVVPTEGAHSVQSGRVSAPIMPQRVQTIRGPNAT